MKNVRISEQIGGQLAAHFASRGLTQAEVAARYRVSQSWVARIYAGVFTPRSGTAMRMCRDAKISFEGNGAEPSVGAPNRAKLTQLLDSVWEGTPEDARYLAEVLRMLKKIRLKPEKQKASRRFAFQQLASLGGTHVRAKISLPVAVRLSVSNYALYPGQNGEGLELDFPSGVTVLAGINGVGKTTLLNLLMRMVLGPMDRKKGDRDISRVSDRSLNVAKGFPYFQKRVPKQLGPNSTATLHLKIGSHKISVVRLMQTMALKSVEIDGKRRSFESEHHFAAELTKLAGLQSAYDFHIVVRYLQFFTEERLPILWSAGTQFEFFKILFFGTELADSIDSAFSDIQRLDTDYRNRRNQLTLRQKANPKRVDPIEVELRALDEMIVIAQQAHEATSSRYQTHHDAFVALQTQARALDAKYDQAEADLAELEVQLQHLDAAFIAQALPGLDDKLRFLMQGIGAGRGCFVCGKVGRKEAQAIGQSLKDGHCFVCHAPVQSSRDKGKIEVLTAHKVRALEQQVAATKNEIADIDASRERNAGEYEKAAAALKAAAGERSEALRKLDSLNAQRPDRTAAASDLQADLDKEEAALAILDIKRKARTTKYREGVLEAKAVMDEVKEELRLKLTAYAEAFLQEKVVVRFGAQDKVNIATGAGDVHVPTFSILMTSSTHVVAQERLTSDSVSESQKEFLDLAFRMALLDLVCRDGATMMVMETPEASLDSWFMLRAAQLIRGFAPSDAKPARKLIATSNVNGTDMIPALLGLIDARGTVRKLSEDERPHLVDLLAETAEATVLEGRTGAKGA